MGLEMQNNATEIKLRAERRAGEMLRPKKLHGGDRKSSGRDVSLKLSNLGVSQKQSSRWQSIAAISSGVPLDMLKKWLGHAKMETPPCMPTL